MNTVKNIMHSPAHTLLSLLAVALLLGGCAGTPTIVKKKGKTPELVRLGRQVNSSYDEFAPQLNADASAVIFTSSRPLPKSEDEIHHLFQSSRTEHGLTSADYKPVNGNADNKAGAVSYDYVHSQVYFVQCYMDDGFGDCDLYVADVDGNTWKNIRNLGPEINSLEWDAHPSVSRDGNTLYFASERGGNSDIYVCTRKQNGTWSTPVNLGEPVNTGGDEKTPFISNDEDYLYFASDDHPGYGGYDLFRSEKRGRAWMAPLNMGVPYNSEKDDVFLTTTTSGDTTYLASNREGGLGGYDIYEIRNVEVKAPPAPPAQPEKQPLIVRYTIKNAFTEQPINAYVSYQTEGMDEIEMQSLTDGVVQHEVVPGRTYDVTASSTGFENGVDEFFYSVDESGIKDRVLLLTPTREAERKVFSFVVEFDFDLFNIRPEEAKKLDTAAMWLTKFPNSTVVASGHTDSMGTGPYNIKLGYNRAKSVSKYVRKYLRKKGVRLQNKIEIRTYGESQPVDTNSTDEGRQHNRRVEIAIVRNE